MTGDANPRLLGPAGKGADRRAEILDAVLEAISERGFAGSTLKELAARVGTGEANILHHFGSKQQLLLEAIRQHDDEDLAGLRDPTPAAVSAIVARHAATPGLIELVMNMTLAATDPSNGAHEYFAGRYERLREAGVAAHGDGVEAPNGVALPGDWIARILLAAADGLQVQWLLDPSIDMASDMERLVSLFDALPGRDALAPEK